MTGKTEAISRGRRQLPSLFDAEEMGRRFRRALREAGWQAQVEAVRAIREAVPGTGFSETELSALVGGYQMPTVERLIALAVLLGLDLRILFPECFDGEAWGSDGAVAITRRTHPWLFRDGCRKVR